MLLKLIGILGLGMCLGIVYTFEATSFTTGVYRLFHWPAMVLTGFGPVFLLCLSSSTSVIVQTFSLITKKSNRLNQKRIDREALYLHRLSQEFFVKGHKAFEEFRIKGMSDFIYKMLDRLSIRMPTTDIKELLINEKNRIESRHSQSLNLINLGVRLSPSIGMLGTILGMVQLLSKLQDPSHIGSDMSLALLTTFYGLFFSITFWTPLQQKIEHLVETHNDGYSQAIQWLDFFEHKKPTSYFDDVAELPEHDTRNEKTVQIARGK